MANVTEATAPHLDPKAPPSPLAPRWHTAVIVSLMLVVAGLGIGLRLLGHEPAPANPTSKIGAIYAPAIVVQWMLALWCIRILRKHNALGALVGRGWTSAKHIAVDLACAAGIGIVIVGSETIWAHFSGETPSAATLALLPTTPIERAIWALVAVSAGFCEEIVYRGYLRVQLSAFWRSRTAGIVGQALLFGLAHAEQGLGPAMRFGAYGIVFALVAVQRRSLVAGIVAHTAIDLSSGFLHH